MSSPHLRSHPVFIGSMLWQWAILLFALGDECRVINYQFFVGEGFYPRGCFPIGYSESLTSFAILAAGLSVTILTFARPYVGLLPYLVWTSFLVYVFSQVLPTSPEDLKFRSLLLLSVPVIGVATALTLVCCYLRSRLRRATPIATTPA